MRSNSLKFSLVTICFTDTGFAFHHQVRQNPERAKKTVHPPRLLPRKEPKAAALLPQVPKKARDRAPSLPRHQGKVARGLDPRDQDQDPKELSLRVCTEGLIVSTPPPLPLPPP